MFDATNLLKSLEQRMENSIKVLENDLKGLRTGRASAHLLDPVSVEAYGSKMSMNQVATISTPDARTISIQVWDKSMVKAVEKAIAEANLGVTPASDGTLIRITLPLLSEERRKELIKLAHKYGENAKISARNVRRDGIEELKKQEKNSTISEDELHNLTEKIQKLLDSFNSKIDNLISSKEKEILKV